MNDQPLSDRSLAIYNAAARRLNDTADLCGRGTDRDWMNDPRYREEVRAYDAVMDLIPEWAAARQAARNEVHA